MSETTELINTLRTFAKERDWEQFNSPKNVAMALSVEAAELLEHFQWLTQKESRNLSADQLQEVGDEMADVFLYLLRLADELGVDLVKASKAKIVKNAKKYPIEKAKGRAIKYNKL